MASPIPGSKRPSLDEFIKMIGGLKVDIYVGANKKHYRLPKDLLCHYSTYFDKCFNGNFKEGLTQKLELPEDDVANFEVLLEYMMRSSTSCLPFQENDEKIIDKCLEFIQYADRYNLGEVCQLVYEPMKKALVEAAKTSAVAAANIPTPKRRGYGYAGAVATNAAAARAAARRRRIEPADVELVFRVAPAGSALRTLVVQDILSSQGVKVDNFKEQARNIPEFAAEMLLMIGSSMRSHSLVDPLLDVMVERD